MKLKLEDYLHLYLGCTCKVILPARGIVEYMHRGKLVSVNIVGARMTAKLYHQSGGGLCFEKNNYIDDVKPILRTLKSLSQQEWEAAPNGGGYQVGAIENFYPPSLFNHLLSLHVDLFGLIDAGLALDGAVTGEQAETVAHARLISAAVQSNIEILKRGFMRSGNEDTDSSYVRVIENYELLLEMLSDIISGKLS